jgi:hypothetical protein
MWGLRPQTPYALARALRLSLRAPRASSRGGPHDPRSALCAVAAKQRRCIARLTRVRSLASAADLCDVLSAVARSAKAEAAQPRRRKAEAAQPRRRKADLNHFPPPPLACPECLQVFPRVRRSVARRSTGASRLVEYVRDVKIELQREETEPDVIEAGYFAKQIVPRPEWLQAPLVREICSASNCVSHAPDDWVHRWLHNEFGWFNRVTDAVAVIPPDQRGRYRLFAYRMFPAVFRGGNRRTILVRSDVHADPIPPTFLSLGFDSINKFMESVLGFECSPLSCNSMAAENHDQSVLSVWFAGRGDLWSHALLD